MSTLNIKFHYLMITLLLMMLTESYSHEETEEIGCESLEIFTERIGLTFENHPIDFL